MNSHTETLIRRLKIALSWMEDRSYADERRREKAEADLEELATLIREPTSVESHYMEIHFRDVEDVGIAWNDNRVWVCFNGVAVFRGLAVKGDAMIRPCIAREYNPPENIVICSQGSKNGEATEGRSS